MNIYVDSNKHFKEFYLIWMWDWSKYLCSLNAYFDRYFVKMVKFGCGTKVNKLWSTICEIWLNIYVNVKQTFCGTWNNIYVEFKIFRYVNQMILWNSNKQIAEQRKTFCVVLLNINVELRKTFYEARMKILKDIRKFDHIFLWNSIKLYVE